MLFQTSGFVISLNVFKSDFISISFFLNQTEERPKNLKCFKELILFMTGVLGVFSNENVMY